MAFLDILLSKRYYFNSEVGAVFNDIYKKIDVVSNDVIMTDREITKKVVTFLLFSSFMILEDMFGEKGFRKVYLMQLSKKKTKKLLAFLFPIFYHLLKSDHYFRGDIQPKIKEEDIHIFYERLFEEQISIIKNVLQELMEKDNVGRMAYIVDGIYDIIIGAGNDEIVAQKIQDMVMLGPYLASVFESCFKTLRYSGHKYLSNERNEPQETRASSIREIVIIKIRCPCGNENALKKFLPLGKDREGYMYLKCSRCNRHIQWDPLTGKIKTRHSFLGIAWGKFVGIISFLTCVSLVFSSYAEEPQIGKTQKAAQLSSALYLMAYMENQDINTDLEKWTDQKMINELSKIALTDNDVKALYIEFKNIIVSPPDPDSYKEYSMINGEKVLENVIHLGRKIHNMLFAISDKNIERYGNLLHAMRDALYIDSKSISFVIKHDNSRDSYWYNIYNKAVRNVDETYEATVSKK